MHRSLTLWCGAPLSAAASMLLVVCAHASPVPPRPSAHRCEEYASRPGKTIDAVLRKATTIAVVHVKSVKPGSEPTWVGENVVYSLQVVMKIKGAPGADGSTIELPGVRMRWGFPFDPSLFDIVYRHSKGFSKTMRVDQAMSTRQQIPLTAWPGYCEYAPYFEVGMDYVVVLSEPYTEISFEPIGSLFDPWLDVVRGYEDFNPLTGE